MSSDRYSNDRKALARYAFDHSVTLHPAQQELIERTKTVPRGVMIGGADEMQLFQNLLKLLNAKRTLDIGAFTGFSALSVALALPDDGKVITMDVTDEYLAKAGAPEIWQKAGVAHKIDLRLGEARKTLADILLTEGAENSFDFAFIDADKENYDFYYESALKLVRAGGIIAVDNTLWGGSVLDPSDSSSATVAIRAINEKIAKDSRVSATFLTMADGVTLCFKK